MGAPANCRSPRGNPVRGESQPRESGWAGWGGRTGGEAATPMCTLCAHTAPKAFHGIFRPGRTANARFFSLACSHPCAHSCIKQVQPQTDICLVSRQMIRKQTPLSTEHLEICFRREELFPDACGAVLYLLVCGMHANQQIQSNTACIGEWLFPAKAKLKVFCL